MRPAVKSIAELERDGAIVEIQDGNHGGSHPKSAEFVPDGIPFIMASDIDADGHIDLNGCAKLAPERAGRLRIGFAQSGDVLLTHKGSVGRVALLGNVDPYVMLTPQVTYYRVNDKLLCPKFLVQAFRSPGVQQQLNSLSAQSTRPYISISTQRHIQLPWVPLNIQQRIADILSAYDELIEVNTRRIAALEEIARRLFDEWFVKLRFPGRSAEVARHSTPVGWSEGEVGSLARFVSRGIAPKYDDDATTLVVNQKCIRDGRLSFGPSRRQSRKTPVEKMVTRFDVLINSTGVGTLGRVAQTLSIPVPTTVDTHVTIVRPAEDVDPYFFGIQLIALQTQFERAGKGSTGQTELSRDAIKTMPVVIPPSRFNDSLDD